MRIEWAENPLATKVTFSPDDQKRLINDYLGWCLDALQGVHHGDCTKVGSACLKCKAESIIGINTLEGMNGFTPYWISQGFWKTNSIDEAIQNLESYETTVEEWKNNATIAAAELKQYRDKYRSHQQAKGAT